MTDSASLVGSGSSSSSPAHQLTSSSAHQPISPSAHQAKVKPFGRQPGSSEWWVLSNTSCVYLYMSTQECLLAFLLFFWPLGSWLLALASFFFWGFLRVRARAVWQDASTRHHRLPHCISSLSPPLFPLFPLCPPHPPLIPPSSHLCAHPSSLLPALFPLLLLFLLFPGPPPLPMQASSQECPLLLVRGGYSHP